jgi:hypothetical protein
MAFKAAIAGLARVRELEHRQQELCERGIEMLRRGLKTLDELNAIEEKEKEEKERVENEKRQQHELLSTDSSFPAGHGLLDLDPAFDPGPEFWATLDAGGGTPQPS